MNARLMVRLLGVLLATLTSSSSSVFAADPLPVRDVDFACTESQKADQYTRDFNIDLSSFGGRELCDAAVDTKKLFNDLQLLEAGRFEGVPENNLIRGFIPADQYYSWIKAETRGIERGQDVPYATAYNSGGYFTMQNGWASMSTLGRVGVVVHEARHTDGYYHIRCTFGPYLDTGVHGCDRDYQYGGSHGVEMEYYARVTTGGVNFHPVYKKMARLMAMGRANFVFNASPLRAKESLMILGQSGRSYLLQGKSWVERETPEGTSGLHLKRTSFGAALFDGLTAFVLDPYQNSGFTWSVTDDFSYYKLLGDDRGIGTGALEDFEEFDFGRKRYLFALTQGRITNYNFRAGAWNSLISAPAGAVRFSTVAPSGEVGLFLLDLNGHVFSVDPERPSQTRPMSQPWDTNVVAYARAEGQLFRLENSGVLKRIGDEGEQVVATPEPASQLVSVPIYDAFEVQP